MKAFLSRFAFIFNSYSEIFFLRSCMAGVLLAVITLSHPHVGVSGLVSVAAAYFFARFIGMSRHFIDSGFYTYNALLVGLSIGYLFDLSFLSLFFIITAGIFTFLLSVMIDHIFGYYFKLPALSLPFVIVSSTAYMAAYGYSNLYVTGAYQGIGGGGLLLPYWLEGFFNALGAILFCPNIYVGMLFALVILLTSRILFLLAVAGFFLGATVSGLMEGAMVSAYLNINNFNFILIAMALGGVFLVPSPRSYVIAAAGVAIATVLLNAVQLFWSSHGIPAFTLPFNLVTLTVLYVLKLVAFPLIAPSPRRTPEETLDDYLCNLNRFKHKQRLLALPFSGQWCVWQGFDGAWTHQGAWRHAYDFVIKRQDSSYQGSGNHLQDYYAYNKPVLSPCRGRVVKVVAGLPDNPPGLVDKNNNWGNLIIIDTLAGWFVELSHFAQHSIQVSEGDWVEVGASLGRCGNSGYSPQPHLHIQVQGTALIGAPTLPFGFQAFLKGNSFIADRLPQEGEIIEAIQAERSLEYKTSFVLDQSLDFKAYVDDNETEAIQLRVSMSDNGETYLAARGSKLFFARDKQSFYFYRLEGNNPWLALIFSALPRLPLRYRNGMTWNDQLPVAATQHGWRKYLIQLIHAFHADFGRSNYQATWQQENRITARLNGTLEMETMLHPQLGFSSLRVGRRRLEWQELTQ